MWAKILSWMALTAIIGLLAVDVAARPLPDALWALLMWVCGFYLALVAHELGHVTAGLLRGMRLMWIVICTLKLSRTNGSWRLTRLPKEQATLGEALCLPRRADLSASDEAWLCAGGPIGSLVTAAVGFTIATAIREPDSFSLIEVVLFGTAAWSAMFGLMSIIPTGSTKLPRSDGQRLLDVWHDAADTRATRAIVSCSGRLVGGARPSELPEALLAAAKAAENAGLKVVASVFEAEARFDAGRRDESLAIARRLTADWDQLPTEVRYTAAGLAAWTHALVARDGTEARKWLEHYTNPGIEPHRRALVEAAVLSAEEQTEAARSALARSSELRKTAIWPVTADDLAIHAEIDRALDALAGADQTAG